MRRSRASLREEQWLHGLTQERIRRLHEDLSWLDAPIGPDVQATWSSLSANQLPTTQLLPGMEKK